MLFESSAEKLLRARDIISLPAKSSATASNQHPESQRHFSLFEFKISRRKKRQQEFEKDYPALLLSLASAIRTGLDPIAAFAQSFRLFEAGGVMQQLLHEFSDQLDRGVPESEAVESFGKSLEHPDLKLFRAALLLSRREGSSLGPCLERLARVTRQRQSFKRKVRAALALQRLSANAIVLCTLAIGWIQYSANRAAVELALSHPLGIKLIGFGLASSIFGLIWMRRLGRAQFI